MNNILCIVFVVCCSSSVFGGTIRINGHIPAHCILNANMDIATSDPGCRKKFSVVTKQVDWHEAYRTCLSDRRQLASIKTEDEQRQLEEQLTASGHSGSLWLGGSDNEHTGEFRWIGSKGAKMSFTNWASSEPEVGFCMALIKSFKWKKESCRKEQNFICEYYD